MAIPDFQSLMLPLLKLVNDGREHSFRESVDRLADQFHLTKEERSELLPSGLAVLFDNRVGWARTYLKKAGLLEATRRGYVKITQCGLEVLQQNPAKINIAFLRRFPEFVEFQKPVGGGGESTEEQEPQGNALVQTPEEVIEAAYQRLRQGLAADLIQAAKERSPAFFERLVIDLLVKMGYGGTRKDAGEAIGRSGDGGIDGIIKEDRLGLDVVYVQAKRWESVVGSPEIHKFVGALAGQNASKGVFITTSSFSQAARDFVSHIGSKVVLIDGDMLARLMIDYNIGVASVAAYELKRVDSDYFAED
jgi:restriction system protein